MKRLLLLLLLLQTQLTNGQDSACSVIHLFNDKISGTSTWAQNDLLYLNDESGNQFGTVYASVLPPDNIQQAVLSINFKLRKKLMCIDKNDLITILFRDGYRTTLKNKRRYNCDGEAAIYFGGVFEADSVFSEFKDRYIEAVRIQGTDNNADFFFTESDSRNFKLILMCLDFQKKKY